MINNVGFNPNRQVSLQNNKRQASFTSAPRTVIQTAEKAVKAVPSSGPAPLGKGLIVAGAILLAAPAVGIVIAAASTAVLPVAATLGAVVGAGVAIKKLIH